MSNSISCPVCSNLCSVQAISCPQCGHPINQTNQNVKAENNSPNKNSPRPSNTGKILRGILWVFFAFSAFIALGAIGTYRSQYIPVGANAAATDFQNKFDIVIQLIPLIIMIIVLAVVYSSKERR